MLLLQPDRACPALFAALELALSVGVWPGRQLSFGAELSRWSHRRSSAALCNIQVPQPARRIVTQNTSTVSMVTESVVLTWGRSSLHACSSRSHHFVHSLLLLPFFIVLRFLALVVNPLGWRRLISTSNQVDNFSVIRPPTLIFYYSDIFQEKQKVMTCVSFRFSSSAWDDAVQIAKRSGIQRCCGGSATSLLSLHQPTVFSIFLLYCLRSFIKLSTSLISPPSGGSRRFWLVSAFQYASNVIA